MPCTPPELDRGSQEPADPEVHFEDDPLPPTRRMALKIQALHKPAPVLALPELPIQARATILRFLHGLPSSHACAMHLTIKGPVKRHGRDFELVAPMRGTLSSMPAVWPSVAFEHVQTPV